MTLDRFASLLIIIHAVFGGIALLTGTISIIAPKGKQWHKKSGKIFYYAMLATGISALIAAVLPGHTNPFLFVVGVFSTYFVISGYRALRYKKLKDVQGLYWDRVLAIVMSITALSMLTYAVYLFINTNQAGWIMLVFGLLSLNTARLDFKALKDWKSLRKKWLVMHIGKITGGYIAAFTAFIVVNDVMHPLLNWLLPTVFGGVFIGYWLRRVKR